MECRCASRIKSWLYDILLILMMMMPILTVSQTQGGCIEEEKTALLEIKASLVDSYVLDVEHFLPSWVDDGGIGDECCDWERVKCNTTTRHVTDLSLSNVMDGCEMIWPLNVSLFLHFKQLTSLNLSFDCLDDNIVSTGLASLKKLEILDLRWNFITNEIFPSLGALTSLKVLYLGDNGLKGYFPAFGLENLEFLDLTNRDFSHSYDSHPTNQIQGFEQISLLKKLRTLSLGYNEVNESVITSLRILPSLKTLDLCGNTRFRSFPAQELSLLPNLEFLLLGSCGFNGTLLPLEALASFQHLVSLDLSYNNFVGSIPSSIHALSSLRELYVAYNMLNGSLPDHGLCELKNLHELDLSGNMFDGSLPQCLNRLSSLKLLDISANHFTGILPPSLIANLTSLEYADFSYNYFEGLFSFSAFSNHTKLEVVRFISENDNFEVETIEPIGWIPRFQLKLLALPSCNINRAKGSVFPEFLFHQRMLWILDLSHNSLVGRVPNWLIENNTMLKLLNLRNNSLDGTIRMSLHSNANTITWLDMSENHINGTIPSEIQKFLPNLYYLNLSMNSLDGSIPFSVGNMSRLWALDLSDNKLSGEVPKGLLTNKSSLNILKLSKNKLHGEVLSDNLTFGDMRWLALDSNCFTGKIGNGISVKPYFRILDISNNFLRGTIPNWIGNISKSFELVVRNNSLEGQFPCGKTSFSFLDISQNYFSGSIPSCLNWEKMKHLHLDSNSFTGSIPNVFHNLTHILTLDIGNNNLSGRIPKFLGRLSNLRILILRKNNFSGYIPKQLCQLSNVSLIDLSGNSLSGSIPPCLHNIISPINHVFIEGEVEDNDVPFGNYQSVLFKGFSLFLMMEVLEIQDEVQFTIKAHSRPFKGRLLDLMVGLDLSCNNLVGEIPKELGLLTQIHSLNLSHNQLTGIIPEQFSNLENIESFDLSYNGLRGEVPSSLMNMKFLAIFNVSYNNLSGRLPDMKAQFSTFTEESYKGNPLLCGQPLKRKCKYTSHVPDSSTKESLDKWYDVDMISFYGSFGSAWVVLLLGFVAVLYINPYWRRRWLDLVEECMYACYYFLDDLVRKFSKLFRK